MRWESSSPRPVPPPQNNPPVTPPPGPSGDADLIITSLTTTTVTVKNQGTVAAGPFTVDVTGRGTARFESGLATGASGTMPYDPPGPCEGNWSAVADSLNEVPESDETNNTRNELDENPIC